MAYLRGFGACLPQRVVDNAEIAALTGVTSEWILQSSGIEQRRFAGADDTVASLGASAARDCLAACGAEASEIALVLMSSGSAERRFPGPASAVGVALGIGGVPAIDLPVASAGSLFGLALAGQLAPAYGNVLVIGSEIMSRAVAFTPEGRDTAILFGDGAGACLVSAEGGIARIVDSALHSDGEFAGILRLEHEGPLVMEGKAVIMQAARKLPRAIGEVLERNQLPAGDVAALLVHQANLNLLTRVAQSVKIPDERCFRNLARYGNTSSASLLIAASEWWSGQNGVWPGPVVFAAFGAGLHWGALLAGGDQRNEKR
jgi:3-oxoacyl-[acyl-carrier-protein] synthase-3